MSDDDERDLPGEVAAAFTLRSKGTPYRAIAAELGISVATAHRRVAQAAEALEFSVGGDVHAQRAREADALDRYTARLEDRLAADDADPTAIVPVLLKVSGARRSLLGLDAPRRIALSDDRATPAQPDPVIVAAVREAAEENARQRAAINRPPRRRGQDGGDDPGTTDGPGAGSDAPELGDPYQPDDGHRAPGAA